MCGGPCSGTGPERAAGVPTGESATRHAALPADTARGRRCVDPGDHRSGQPVWTLWISPHHGGTERRWLACGQGPSRAHLATRRAEGPTEAEAARAVVVQRWIVRAAASGTRESCMEL